MLYKNWLFLVMGFVSVCVLTHPTVAAPTVKKLSNSVDGIQNNKILSTKSSITGKRAPSVRTLGSSAKTMSKAVNNVKSVKNATTKSADSLRLSGLHGTVIKGIGTKVSPSHTPQPSGINISDLELRVNALEEGMIIKSGEGLTIDGNQITLSEEIRDLPGQVADINQRITELNDKFDDGKYYTIDEKDEYVQKIISQLLDTSIADHFDPSFLTNTQGQ